MSPIQIKEPVWNGGARYVSVRKDRLKSKHNYIEILAKNKKGERIYPNYFYVPAEMVSSFEVKKYHWGEAFIVPLSELNSVNFWFTIGFDEDEYTKSRDTLENLVFGVKDYLDKWESRDAWLISASMEAGKHSVDLTGYVRGEL
jgi:hypothetical protein